jgi:glycosyltransferase involved in cell wall biosynthesis
VVWGLADALDDAGLSTAVDVSEHGVPTYATRLLICCEDSRPFATLGADARILWVMHGDPDCSEVDRADAVVFSSNFHRDDVRSRHPQIDPDKCTIIGHGITPPPPVRKVAGRMLYASAPERGLHHALRIFRLVRKKVPAAELHVTYGTDAFVERFRYHASAMGLAALECEELLRQPGVTVLGEVDQERAAREMAEATVLLYPCDPERPSENFCVSIGEALMAETIPLFSDADCLREVWGEIGHLQLPVNDEEWARTAVELLTSRKLRRVVRRRMLALAPGLGWGARLVRWRELIADVTDGAMAGAA